MTFIAFRKKWIIIALAGLIIGAGLYLFNPLQQEAGENGVSTDNERYVINMVTGEFKSETESGEEIESYRWDPGTIYLPAGEPVTLSIYGVNGAEHPFIIENTNVSGTVKKGQETVLHLQFSEPGIYRLICTAHETIADNGPMIAYLVVN